MFHVLPDAHVLHLEKKVATTMQEVFNIAEKNSFRTIAFPVDYSTNIDTKELAEVITVWKELAAKI